MKPVCPLNPHFNDVQISYLHTERLAEGAKLEVHGAVETAITQNEKKIKVHSSEKGIGRGRSKGSEFDKLKAMMMEL